MIKIEIKKDKLTIKGHSGYSEYGSDIVCASVSSMSIITVNAISKYDEKAVKCIEEDGLLEIDILKHDKIIDLLIDNLIEHLKELKKQYNKYIEIK